MNYNFSETTFPSKDGIHTIYAEIYTPKHRSSKGIIQLSHGMIDYVGRYRELADFLTGEGYVFAGHHHLGHGKSVSKSEEFGIFAENGGVDYVIADMYSMNRYLRHTFPTLPLIVMGHSMGSFITRLYVEKYPHSMVGVIIHGTGGPNPAIPFGRALASLIRKIKGPTYRSPLIEKLVFGSYNSKFPKTDGKHAWLTRDTDLVKDRDDDKFTSFKFTVSGYMDLFSMLANSNSAEWYEKYPKDLPTLIMSGDMDPVGNYGKGPDHVYKHLLISGCTKVDIKLYEGARHELFNETNRADVYADIIEWVESIK